MPTVTFGPQDRTTDLLMGGGAFGQRPSSAGNIRLIQRHDERKEQTARLNQMKALIQAEPERFKNRTVTVSGFSDVNMPRLNSGTGTTENMNMDGTGNVTVQTPSFEGYEKFFNEYRKSGEQSDNVKQSMYNFLNKSNYSDEQKQTIVKAIEANSSESLRSVLDKLNNGESFNKSISSNVSGSASFQPGVRTSETFNPFNRSVTDDKQYRDTMFGASLSNAMAGKEISGVLEKVGDTRKQDISRYVQLNNLKANKELYTPEQLREASQEAYSTTLGGAKSRKTGSGVNDTTKRIKTYAKNGTTAEFVYNKETGKIRSDSNGERADSFRLFEGLDSKGIKDRLSVLSSYLSNGLTPTNMPEDQEAMIAEFQSGGWSTSNGKKFSDDKGNWFSVDDNGYVTFSGDRDLLSPTLGINLDIDEANALNATGTTNELNSAMNEGVFKGAVDANSAMMSRSQNKSNAKKVSNQFNTILKGLKTNQAAQYEEKLYDLLNSNNPETESLKTHLINQGFLDASGKYVGGVQ